MGAIESGAEQISLLELKEVLDNDPVFAAEALKILENDYERPKSTYTLATSATALLEKWIERNELACRERGVAVDITSAAIVLYPDENGDYGPASDAVESTWLISLAEFAEQVRHCQMTFPNALVRSASEDELRPNQFGYTIEGAAHAIATQFGVPEQRLRDSIFEATARNDLTVRDPQTGLPYTPKVRRDFWERISVADLNAWFERSGVTYRLDPVPTGAGAKQGQKWSYEALSALLREHNRLKAQKHPKPTKELATQHRVSVSRLRELLASARAMPDKWKGLGGS